MKKAISICKYCGKEFDSNRLGRRKLYCCTKCANLAHYTKKLLRAGLDKQLREEQKIKKAYQQRYAKSHERMNAIAKMQRETGVSYGLLSQVWENKEDLARCIARYRRR